MPSFLLIAQLLLAVALVAAILMQVKGGGLGGIFGQPDSVYRTRRGLEKTLLQVTIVLAVMFVILSIVIVRVSTV